MNILEKIFNYLDLRSEIEDYNFIHSEIEKGIEFKGTNLWILFFAIIIASVGLNTNSTAVIIGAMLISPLMGPINGMGYSLATYNFELLRKSVKNYSFAVLTGLAASTFYFAVSPVSTAHSELLARTSPTIYDVLIALFGGLAGIVAISSKLKGNVIPGVAIATALMPPLCTAGYGLGTGQLAFFFGAIYLFTINTVFIAISSVIISQFLKFPIRTLVDQGKRKKIYRYISTVIVLTLLPSIYFGYVLVQNEKFTENASKYTQNITIYEGSYLLKSDIDASKRSINLVYGGNSLTEANKADIREKAQDFNLKKAEISISQGFSFQEGADDVEMLKNQISALTTSLNMSSRTIDSLNSIPLFGKQIFSEINQIYPQILACSFAPSYFFSENSGETEKISLVVFTIKKKSMRASDEENVKRWLKARLKTDSVKVVFDEKTAK